MRSRKLRRRSGNGSFGDSLKGELYDQLLTSLAEGGEPLATDDEYGQWVRGFPVGQDVPYLVDEVPRAIARYQALESVRVFTSEIAMRGARALDEVEGSPLRGEEFLAEWREWREQLIPDFKLQALVQTEEGGA